VSEYESLTNISFNAVLRRSADNPDVSLSPTVFSFKKLRASERSRSSETTTPPQSGPITSSPDTSFTPEMGVKTDPSAREMFDVIKCLELRLESVIEKVKENQNKLIEN
jgi:hypothetical protein